SYCGIIYQNTSGTVSIIEDSLDNPGLSTDWSFYDLHPFWNPSQIYSSNDFVYNSGEYYYYDNSGTIDFYDPSSSYNINDHIIYDGDIYHSLENGNTTIPTTNKWSKGKIIPDNPLWILINGWDPTKVYNTTEYSFYKNTLYQ